MKNLNLKNTKNKTQKIGKTQPTWTESMKRE